MVLGEEKLKLPLRRMSDDFVDDLEKVLNEFVDSLRAQNPKLIEQIHVDITTRELINCLKSYFQGLPQKAYSQFNKLVDNIWEDHPRVFRKLGDEIQNDDLILYRMRVVEDECDYKREEIFHLPYHLKEKAKSYRYSISGYPCLYLNTELSACYDELKIYNRNSAFILASGMKLDRTQKKCEIEQLNILDLAQKPEELDLFKEEEKRKYLTWFPILMACSFVRKDKKNDFSAEYIIPQMLLQYIRLKAEDEKGTLWGIRYFSCASAVSSERGINYVIPVCDYSKESHYCKTLKQLFFISSPILIRREDCPSLSQKKEYSEFWKEKEKEIQKQNFAKLNK